MAVLICAEDRSTRVSSPADFTAGGLFNLMDERYGRWHPVTGQMLMAKCDQFLRPDLMIRVAQHNIGMDHFPHLWVLPGVDA